MLAPPQARRSEPGGAATQEEAVEVDSNASYAGEVERKVWLDDDSLPFLNSRPGQFRNARQR